MSNKKNNKESFSKAKDGAMEMVVNQHLRRKTSLDKGDFPFSPARGKGENSITQLHATPPKPGTSGDSTKK